MAKPTVLSDAAARTRIRTELTRSLLVEAGAGSGKTHEMAARMAAGVAAGKDLKQVFADTRKVMDPVFGHVFIYEHCLPFDVSRAYDEASGIRHPRIWTAERDMAMWKALQG